VTVTDLSPDLQKALTIGQEAGDILLKHFKQQLNVDFKKDEFDPVTAADREADDFLREAIIKAFPGDQILTEENPLLPKSYEGRVWMIDPLDGTRDFVAGRDCFSINIGRIDAGVPMLGILLIPARGWILVAEKGQGAYEARGNQLLKIHTSSVTNIGKTRLLTHSPSKEIRPLERLIFTIPFKSHVNEGGGAKQVRLATGKAEVQINTNTRASKWDILAGQVIITEAGGVVSDLDGKSIDYTKTDSHLDESYMASNNRAVHDQVVEAMKPWRDYIA
jgi:3'(2'), 5'-bisphosphate nucleotidase